MNTRTFLATSNHGNHIGFDRKWTVEEIHHNQNPLVKIALKVSDDHRWIDDNSEIEDTSHDRYVGAGVYDASMNLEVTADDTSYEHDLVYYLLISENEIDAYSGDNGHYSGLYGKLCTSVGIEE